MDFKDLPRIAKKARTRLLQMHYESNVGHIGGNLSCIDLLLVTYLFNIKPEDILILSKGHAAGALYIVLNALNSVSESDLLTFHRDNTLLAGHPPVSGIKEIRFATGSLGHGFSISNGIAIAKKLKNNSGHVFCLTSDGEWNEGSTWEALNFMCHHKLNNLTVIIDQNGIQGFGTTKEVMNIGSLYHKLSMYEAETIELDGHNFEEIQRAINKKTTLPRIIVAKTTKGKGVSFMENSVDWHYWPLSQQQYTQAIEEVENS